MWGWLVCLITVECVDFKVSVSLFASDQVVLCSHWSYGSMVRAAHGHTWKREERNNRSARWGSRFSLMRLEACVSTGETITTRFLLSTLVPLISLLVYLVCVNGCSIFFFFFFLQKLLMCGAVRHKACLGKHDQTSFLSCFCLQVGLVSGAAQATPSSCECVVRT